jgi:predicted metalloprotease with PDZ domain
MEVGWAMPGSRRASYDAPAMPTAQACVAALHSDCAHCYLSTLPPATSPAMSFPLIGFSTALLSLAVSLGAAQPPSGTLDDDAREPIVLAVDLTDVAHRVFRVHEELPVAPGPLTLLYPQWLPGNHAPTGPLSALGGLTIRGNGQRIEWRRDPVDLFAFHVDVPAGVTRLAVDFQFLSPTERRQGRIVATPEILGLQWNTVLLYPRGRDADAILFAPQVTLPTGWHFATALEDAGTQGAVTRFGPVALDALVDSPLFAGRHFRRFDLDPGAERPVHLNVFADAARLLDAKPEIIASHRKLVEQADRLFGARHYPRYEFLLALSDRFSGIGLEHAASSENATFPSYLVDPQRVVGRDLLAHEYSHAWNGKFRRSAGLATPNFNVPMQSGLLWVYEGQTQYWGYVLAARAGMLGAAQVRDALALVAATYDHREGRVWRSLGDTTMQPAIGYREPLAWPDWQRNRDYYSEGQLVWLDVDTRIRELSGGRRSLDDFAHRFFGVQGDRMPLTYTLDEIVATLERVQPGGWAAFLRERIDGHGPGAPLDGLIRAGWKITYAAEPSAYQRDDLKHRHIADFSYSLGFSVSTETDRFEQVLWDSPAFDAGIASGMTLVAVDGIDWSEDELKAAVIAAGKGGGPIDLLVKNLDHYETLRLDYHGGLRYPRLERVEGTPDRLADILAPRR